MYAHKTLYYFIHRVCIVSEGCAQNQYLRLL